MSHTKSYNAAFKCCCSVLTAPPAVQLSLQPGDGAPERLVFLLLPLPLVLPLLCGQLYVQTHCVLNGLCSNENICFNYSPVSVKVSPTKYI